MAGNLIYGATIKTPTFRASFPHLFEPYRFPTGSNFSADEKSKYSVIMAFDKETAGIQWLREKVALLAKEIWPTGWPEGARSPVKDGDKDGLEDRAGCWIVDAHSYTRPGVIDKNKEAIIDPERIYGGCYLRATITLAGYTSLGGGVTVFLNNVQFVADGERFGQGSSAFDDFDVIEDDAPADVAKQPPAGTDAGLPF